MIIGYHASHEQFKPGQLLALVRRAEEAGFNGATCSDHFHPWSNQQGESGFSWSWLGAALQATGLSFGTVSAPGYRYHPAIIAQASATLAEMFPGRFWLAAGSGEMLNEGITGQSWPIKEHRNERLLECADIIRRLWAGDKVTVHSRITVEEARLFTRPETPPPLIGAAITPETAEWLGSWADGLLTISQPGERLAQVVAAFRRSKAGPNRPMYLKVQLSYAASEEEALQGAWEQWRTVIHSGSLKSDLRSPEQFEDAAQFITPEDVRRYVNVSADPGQHVAWLKKYMDVGFERLYLHNVNRQQERFITDFGEHVLPKLR